MPKDILDDLMLEEGLDFSPKKDNRVTEVIDLEGDTTPVAEEKDYDLIRNNVKLLKTDLDYIYQLKDGSGYVYRLYHKESKTDKWVMKNPATVGLIGLDGKKQKPVPFRTKQDAMRHMGQELDKLTADKAYKYKNITFDQVWTMFMNSSHDKANETIRRYNSIYIHHVKKEFGNLAISEIETQKYNELFVKLHRTGDGRGKKLNGYSYAYVQSVLKFIYLVVSQAYYNHFITSAQYTRFDAELAMPGSKKKSDKKKIRVLTSEQIRKIQELLKPTDYYLPFLISLLGGLRPAETFALCFEDVDFKNCTISIDKQIVEESTGKLIIKEPKTDKSTRVIEVPLVLIQEIQKRKRALEEAQKEDPVLFEQNKRKFIDGREFREDIIEQPNFINVDRKGRYITAHSFSYYTKIIKRDICPNNDEFEDFSFYTFRKTHLSNMASNNCPVGELMSRAGHSKMETLYDSYYGRTEASEEKLIRAMNETASLIL